MILLHLTKSYTPPIYTTRKYTFMPINAPHVDNTPHTQLQHLFIQPLGRKKKNNKNINYKIPEDHQAVAVAY